MTRSKRAIPPPRGIRALRYLTKRMLAGGTLPMLCAVSCGARVPPRPPSLLLISIDSLRADHVHAYGYTRRTTPTLDALAARGTRLARVWANSPWTLPSHATMLTGTLPYRHGLVDDGATLGASAPLLAPVLKEHGYATAGVVSGFYVSSRFGFDRGFDRFEEFGLPHDPRPMGGIHGGDVTDRAAGFLKEAGARPFFLFVHYFDCHYNYEPPAPYDRAFDEDASIVPYVNYDYYRTHPVSVEALAHIIAQYDEGILYADAQIGRLLEALVEQGREQDTYIVVTADHGEEFYEHGSWGHAHTLYSEVMEVPLILVGPAIPKGRVLKDLVRHEDLAPTLLDLLSVPPPLAMQGSSYAALVAGSRPSVGTAGTLAGPQASNASDAARGERLSGASRVDSGAGGDRFVLMDTSRFSTNKVGMVSGGQALIVDIAKERTELFDIDRDPREKTDLAPTRGADIQRLFPRLYKAILHTVADRWAVSWSGGAAGRASCEGFLLSGVPPPAPGGKLPFDRLKSWESSGEGGEVRLTSVPPDSPISFEVMEKPSLDPIRFRVDPIADGARLRAAGGVAVARPGTGPALSVRIESPDAAPAPSVLTPEEIERLNSLGYLH